MEYVYAVYGLVFFTMGVSVAVRATAMPASPFRTQLLALAAFGFLHGAFEWLLMLDLEGMSFFPRRGDLAVSAASFLALLALGLRAHRAFTPHAPVVVAAAAAGWLAAALIWRDPVALEVLTRIGLGLPASMGVAAAVIWHPSMRVDEKRRNRAHFIAAFAFAAYGLSQLISSPGAFFPASVLNVDVFAETFAVPIVAVRALLGLVATVSVLALLGDFHDWLHTVVKDEAKTARNRLKESEGQLAKAQRIGNIGSWDWDIATNALEWSDQTYRIFGLEPRSEEATYPRFLEFVHPEDRHLVEQAVNDALKQRTPYSIRHRLIRPDGEIRTVLEQGEADYDADARPLRMIGVVHDITEAAKLEEENENQSHFLQNFIDSLFVFVGIFTLDGTMVHGNRAPNERAGLEPEEVIGKKFWETYWWSYSDESISRLRQALEGAAAGEINRGDFVVRMSDDQFVTIDAMFGPMFDKNGHITHIVGSAVDVTERVQAHEALRESEARLRESAEKLEEAQRIGNMGSWALDYATGDLKWSNQIFRIFGFEKNGFEPTPEFLIECVPEEDRHLIHEAFSKAGEDRKPFCFDHRIVGGDGKVRIVNQQGEVETGPNGEILRLTGAVQDVTELRAAAAALRESREMLFGVLSISPEATIVADEEFRIILFSSGASDIFGYKPEEVIGQNIQILVPERFRQRHDGLVRSFATGDCSARQMGERSTIIGLRRNGEEFPAEASLSRLPTSSGPVFTTVLRDISERLAHQEELVTAKLAAEEANLTKSRFIANISHELRTPLNAIIGFSSLLETGKVAKEKVLEYAGDIRQSGEHLLALINDVLDISRIEIGKMDLNDDRPVDLGGLISYSTRMLAGNVGSTGLALETHIPDDLPFVKADARLITQILLNLLSNATKFTPEGGRIDVTAEIGARGEVVMAVHDTGIGMSPEDIARLGEPFVQVDARLSRKYNGAGLGFAIAKHLAHMHGGSMRVESEPGKGTSVYVILPRERVIAAGTSPPQTGGPQEAGEDAAQA